MSTALKSIERRASCSFAQGSESTHRGDSVATTSQGEIPRRSSVTMSASITAESKRRGRWMPRSVSKSTPVGASTDSTQVGTPFDDASMDKFMNENPTTAMPSIQISALPHPAKRNTSSASISQQQHDLTGNKITSKDIGQVDDGYHQTADFENMIIECDNDDSSFGDITYDESIADEDYYRNRCAQQRPSRTTSVSRSNDKRSSVSQKPRQYPHDQRASRNAQEGRSPQRQNVMSIRSNDDFDYNRDQRENQQPGVFIESIDGQEMALIELAMERSLRDCGGSVISRTTHRSYTSNGSCSTNHSAVSGSQASVSRMWKREGKKWSKVPNMDEHNLQAIDEEKDIATVQSTCADSQRYASSPKDYSSNSNMGYDDQRIVTPTSVSDSGHAGLTTDKLHQMEQDMIEEALHRSLYLSHSSLSNMSSFGTSPSRNRRTSRSSSASARSSMGGDVLPLPFDSSPSRDYKAESIEEEQEREMIALALERSIQDNSIRSISSNTTISYESSRSGISHNQNHHMNIMNNSNSNSNTHIKSPMKSSGSVHSGSARPPLSQKSRSKMQKSSNGRLDGAGCHLAMIGGKRPSTRAILNGIDYEEDEEELMAEHLPSAGSNFRGDSCDASVRSENTLKLIWKRGPNNKWGKFPEYS